MAGALGEAMRMHVLAIGFPSAENKALEHDPAHLVAPRDIKRTLVVGQFSDRARRQQRAELVSRPAEQVDAPALSEMGPISVEYF